MSDIEPKKLKVADLRDQLRDRGLDTKGNKAALVKRLEKALRAAALSHTEESGDSDEEDGPESALDTSCDDSMLNKTAESDAPEGQEDQDSSPEVVPIADSPSPPAKQVKEPSPESSPEPVMINQPSPSPSPEPVVKEVEEPEDVQQIESSPEPVAADEPEDQQMSEPEAIEADQAAPKREQVQQVESDSESEEEEDLPQQQPEDEQMSEPEAESESESEPEADPEPKPTPVVRKPEAVKEPVVEQKMEVDEPVELKPEPVVEKKLEPVDEKIKEESAEGTKPDMNNKHGDEKPEDIKEEVKKELGEKKENDEVKKENDEEKKENDEEKKVKNEEKESKKADDGSEAMDDDDDDDDNKDEEKKMLARKRRHADDWERTEYRGNRDNRDYREDYHDRDHFRSYSPQHRVQEPEENEDWLKSTDFLLDKYNSDLNLRIADDGLKANPITVEGFAFMWAGARANYGVKKGKVCYEVELAEHLNVDHLPQEESNRHVVRIGWSTDDTTTQLGEEKNSWGYGGTGKSSTECKFTDFGETFGENDVVACYLDMDSEPITVSYTKNGTDLGMCFEIEKSTLEDKALFPHVLTKNTEFTVNFGQKEKPNHEPKEGYILMNAVPAEERIRGATPPKKKKVPTATLR